ncbi:hypothetical protein CLJ1_4875 [Pseudomonas paraeruginosa]|nr:hypothetical protein CLJ1_4875 [Pseudomonas aeruginosa]
MAVIIPEHNPLRAPKTLELTVLLHLDTVNQQLEISQV